MNTRQALEDSMNIELTDEQEAQLHKAYDTYLAMGLAFSAAMRSYGEAERAMWKVAHSMTENKERHCKIDLGPDERIKLSYAE